MRKFLLLIFASLISTWLIGQTVTLGTGTSTNTSSGYPCPYANYYKNCRTQYLVTAAELTALGVTSSNITALAFNVSALNGVSALPNFSIKLKATTATVLTTTFDNTGLSEVFLAPSLTVTTGWNTHAFTTPFFWDGTSNVLIDICYSLTTSYTNNPSVYYTATTAVTSAYYKNDTYVACGTTSAATTSSNRANMQITYQAVSGPLPPSNLVTTVINNSQINLGWTKNAAANNVMVAYNTTNTFGTPVSGTAYTAGQSISGGGTVIYNGSDVAFNHTGLSAGTTYYYKAWSVDGTVAYSNGISTSATTMFAVPYIQNFESGLTLPLGWGGAMSVIASHGTSASNGLTYELWSSATSGNATTPSFGNITSTCFLEFDYRIVNWSGYPATATTLGASDKIEIQISTDNGATYTTIYTINQSNHVTSTSFVTKGIDLSAYAGQNVKFKYLLTWGTGDYYVDVDNFHVYVPSPMTYVSSTAAQVTGILPQGATNQLIIGLQVVTSGSLTPLPISSFTFNTNGTTNVSDIVNAKLWSSGTNSSPSSATMIGDVILNPSGIMTFDAGTGLPITLANGNNYFWLTYDVSPSAIPGDVLDAECNSFIFGGISEIPTIQAPAGNRLVRTPLSGIYTIDNTLPTGGTNYASFDDAVNELDILGVNGAVTFNVTAGQTFNVTCGASPYNYAYAITKSGTAANPIIFQKYGAGDNPIVNITGTSATNDIGFFLYGCDYVTFDGIKVMDAGTTSSNYLERGFYLQGPADNNCNNVTIKNCIVDLTKTNTSSYGLYSYSYTPTSLANTNSNNKFLNNTVQDCYNGYYFSGNSTYPDNGNEIGTASGGTSTITNIANYGIYYTNQTGLKIYGNTINNISSSSGAVYGIYESSGSANTVDIYSNTISALSSTSSYAYGICITTGTTHNVYSNTMFDISSSISDAYGFAISSGTNTIYKNKIYNVRYTGTSTYTASGLAISGGVLNNVYNNYIFDIKAASSTSSPGTKGMNISGGTADNVFYNTVYLDYTSAVASNSSAALYVSSPTMLDLRNNIFVNNSLMTTGTRAVAFYKSSSGFAIISANTNNNLYYAGTPGTKNLIYYDGTNSYQTLDAYIAAISTKDQQAKTENVPFVSTTSPYDLHVNTAVATQAESGGIQVTTPFAVANDFDGDIRWGETGYAGSGSSTDIGADEFNGIIMDLTPPSIVYTALTGTTSTSNRTLTNVVITDIISGINTTPGTKPRLYFKKSTDNNAYVGNTSADNGWKWVEATGNSSPFSFVIDYSKLNGGLVAANDVIQYFVIAQDLATTPNVGINTGSFAAKPASVDLTATAFPIGGTPFSYGILTSIAGNISVGTGQTITSLTANSATGLFYVLNNSVVTGNLTVSVVSDLTETGATALNQWVEEGAGNYTLTIQPSDATTKTISGAYAGSLIRINGADRMTINGNFNGLGKYLTFINSSTSSPKVFEFLTGAGNNAIKNCNISTGAISSGANGIYVSASGVDNLVIDNNVITKTYYGVNVNGVSGGVNYNGQITNNIIGSATDAEAVAYRAVAITYSDNMLISNNELKGAPAGVSTYYQCGVYVGTGSTNTKIKKNIIHDFYYTGTSGYGNYGIWYASDASTVTQIHNNVIYNIKADGDQSAINYNPIGIYVSAGGNLQIYYNSIYLSGSTLGSSYSGQGIGVGIASGITLVNLRNNIIQNSMTTAAGTGANKTYAVYCLSPNTAFTAINNNDYFVNGINPQIGYLAGDFATLAAWRGATGQDMASINADPLYTSTSNLTLSTSPASPAIGFATPLSGIVNDDILGNLRSLSFPTMGAYEYTAVVPTVFNVSGSGAYCQGSSGLTVTLNGSETGVNYQLMKDNANLGNVVTGTGEALNWIDLLAGTYTVKASMAANGLSIMMNGNAVITETIPLPVSVVITASVDTLCAGTNITYTAMPTNGGTPTYQWYKNNEAVGLNQNTYDDVPLNGDQVWVIMTSSETCVSGNPATSNIIAPVVNPLMPVSVSISASANPVFEGTAVTFTAIPQNPGSAPVYNWFVNNTLQVGATSYTYEYVPANGDQVYCTLTSNIICATNNPATSNMVDMQVNPNTITQNYELISGYQFISSYVIPTNPDMMEIMTDLLNNNLSFVRNSNGNMLRKIGQSWVNNIGDWTITEGYIVKMNAPGNLSITGLPVDPLTPINLNAGYQFISYFHDYPMDASTAFTEILNDNLSFIRNSTGNMLRKIGLSWVNNIGNVIPGEGYLVKMNAPATLIYPAGTKSESIKNNAEIQHFNFEGGNAADPVYTVYISDATINGYTLQAGDEIGVYDGEILVGALALTQTPNAENQFENAIPVFATLNSGEGFTANHPVTFKLWSQGQEYEGVNVTLSNPYGDAYTGKVYPNSDGIYSIASLKATTNGVGELSLTSVQLSVYPNPSNGNFTIELNSAQKQEVDMKITNSLGVIVYQKLMALPNGKQITEIHLNNLPDGIYTISARNKEGIINNQLIINR
jgi:hypothetical protein